MRTLKDLLKRLLCWALLLALLVLAAAGTVLGVQGWKLYRGCLLYTSPSPRD